MEIRIALEKEDWKAYQSYIEKELPKHIKSWASNLWAKLLLGALFGTVFILVDRQLSLFHWPTAIAVSGIFILIIGLFVMHLITIRKAFEPSEHGSFCGEHFFKFTDQGIQSTGRGYEATHSWAIVKKIERTEGMILIFIDTVLAYVFPESKLSDPNSLYTYISDQYSKATRQVGHQ